MKHVGALKQDLMCHGIELWLRINSKKREYERRGDI